MCHHAVVVDTGVPQIDAHRINTMALDSPHQSLGSKIQRLLPLDLAVLVFTRCAPDSFYGSSQSVGVRVYILQGYGLWTNMASTQWIIPIAFDRHHLGTLGFNYNATNSFAKVAGSIVLLYCLTHSRYTDSNRYTALPYPKAQDSVEAG